MSYQIAIESKRGYLHAVVTGVNSRDAVMGYLAEVRDRCERAGVARVLIEERLTGPRRAHAHGDVRAALSLMRRTSEHLTPDSPAPADRRRGFDDGRVAIQADR